MPHRLTHPGGRPRCRALGGWLLAAALVAWPALLSAQERTVTGTVTSEESLAPLVGVQVTVKGTNIGAITNGEGSFSLRVPADATTLVFTSLGYRTVEIPIQDQVEVALEQQAIQLEGLVVTALGIEREKRSLGYSVQDIRGDELTRVPKTNIVSALQGSVAGVHVTDAGPTGGSSRVVIRGASSIAGDNQPLFVIDGVPVDNRAPENSGFGGSMGSGGIDWGNRAQDIDPANIESVSVLKGPNAAALYGSRASNGAVVITTKSGSGEGSAGVGITATTSLTFETPLRLPSYQNQYGQGSGGQYSFVDGDGAGTFDFFDESWGPKLDGRLIDQFTGPQMPWVPAPDNVRNFFETGRTWRTNVSIARATETTNLRLSVSNDQVGSMAPGNDFDKIGLALRGGAQLGDRISIDGSVNYISNEAANRMGTGYDENNPMQSFIWFGRQVDMEALRNYRCTGNERTACLVGEGQYNWNYNYHNNPFWEQFVNGNDQQIDRLIGNLRGSVQLNDWLTLGGGVGRDWYREGRKNWVAFNSLDDAGDGGFAEATRYVAETNADVTLAATRQLSSDITLNVTAGANLRENAFESTNVSVDALLAPDIYTIDNAAIAPQTTDYNEVKKVRSAYGSTSFNYAGWFNVDVTGRNDWSSTLPEGNRSYFYPSVSSALVFTDALGWQSSLLSSGKVRASWTRVGNDTDPYKLASVFNPAQPWGTVPMFGTPNDLANANLKPEQTTAWELGADLGFLDERLGFVLTYYNSRTKDQILGIETSATSGFTNQLVNAGVIENKGWELLLRATPINKPNGLRWDMTVNWSKNNALVADLYGDVETVVIGDPYWSLNIEARKGEPYGVMFGDGYLLCGDSQIDAGDCAEANRGEKMLSEDGLPLVDGQRRVLGNYNPDWNGGIFNRFSYGPFELSVLVDGQMGGDIFSTTNWWGEYSGVLESSLRGRENDFCDPGITVRGVMPDGSVNGDGVDDVTVCPQTFFEGQFGNQEAGIADASYIKLREVRLGFSINAPRAGAVASGSLPQRFISQLGFSGVDIGLIGRNLFLWSNIENIDPETAFDASNRQGLEFGQFPTARSIGFTLSIRP